MCCWCIWYSITHSLARATNTAFIGDPYTKINSACHLNTKDFVPTPDSALVLEDGIISCKIKVDEMRYGRMCFPVYETAQSVKVVITPSGKVNVSCKYEEEDEM